MEAKNLFLVIVFQFLGWVPVAQAQSSHGGLRKVHNDAFQLGEKLEYRVHYGAITAGTARLEVKKEPVQVNGRPCYQMVGTGISSRSFSLFFRVNDRYETFVDMESLMPWKFKRKIEEGDFKVYSEVAFDQFNQKAYERRSTVKHITTYDVPAYIQDVMSAFYYARTQSYQSAKPGDVVRFQNFIDKKVHDLDVLFLGRETIEVAGVTYKTVKLKPLVREGGIFQHEGEMYLWITDDANRVPVRVESGVVIGSVQVDLVKAENLAHAFTARVN